VDKFLKERKHKLTEHIFDSVSKKMRVNSVSPENQSNFFSFQKLYSFPFFLVHFQKEKKIKFIKKKYKEKKFFFQLNVSI